MSKLTNRGDVFEMPADGWYQLAPLGEYSHAGSGLVQVLDAAACLAMVNRFKVDAAVENFAGLLVDFDHFSLDSAQRSEAAGWISELENRADGLYGKIRWSDTGEAAVKGGRYRFISPVWNRADCADLGNGRVRPERLLNAAVTNEPNIKGMVPLSNRAAPAAGGKCYVWKLGTSPEDRHCPSCTALAGQVHTMAEWKAGGVLPRDPDLYCGSACHCRLEGTSDASSGAVAVGPVRVENSAAGGVGEGFGIEESKWRYRRERGKPGGRNMMLNRWSDEARAASIAVRKAKAEARRAAAAGAAGGGTGRGVAVSKSGGSAGSGSWTMADSQAAATKTKAENDALAAKYKVGPIPAAGGSTISMDAWREQVKKANPNMSAVDVDNAADALYHAGASDAQVIQAQMAKLDDAGGQAGGGATGKAVPKQKLDSGALITAFKKEYGREPATDSDWAEAEKLARVPTAERSYGDPEPAGKPEMGKARPVQPSKAEAAELQRRDGAFLDYIDKSADPKKNPERNYGDGFVFDERYLPSDEAAFVRAYGRKPVGMAEQDEGVRLNSAGRVEAEVSGSKAAVRKDPKPVISPTQPYRKSGPQGAKAVPAAKSTAKSGSRYYNPRTGKYDLAASAR